VAAVAHAHAHGVVHRDLKPSNVLVSADGALKLIDFGIARAVGDALRLTLPQVAAGTPIYMSPEQKVARPANPRDDVWALGVMLREMLAPVWPHVPALPRRRLLAIVALCTAHHAAGRYRDAGELLRDLRAVAEGRRPLATSLRGRTRRTLAAARQGLGRVMAAAVVVGVGIPLALWAKWPREATARQPATQATDAVQAPVGEVDAGLLAAGLRTASQALRQNRYGDAQSAAAQWAEMSIAARLLRGLAATQGSVQHVECDVSARQFRRLAGCTAGVVLTQAGELRTCDPCAGTSQEITHVRGGKWTAFDCTADGSAIVCGTRDGAIHLFGEPQRWNTASASGSPCVRVHVDQRARFVIACHQDGTLALLDGADGKALHAANDHVGQLTSSALAIDGNSFAAVYESGVLTVRGIDASCRSFATARHLRAGAAGALGGTHPLRAAAFLADGRLFVAGDRGLATLWAIHADVMEPALRLSGCQADLRVVAVAPSGKLVAAQATDRAVYVWRCNDPDPGAISIALQGELATDLSFLGEGTLIWLDGTRKVSGWSIPALATPQTGGHLATAWKVKLSPSGRDLATVGNDETLRLWSAQTRAPVATLRGHQNRVLDVVWSPDSLVLATASSDGTVRVWDRGSGTATVLRGHKNEVHAVKFVADGRALLSASRDGTVLRWDRVRGTSQVAIREPFEITAMDIREDGDLIALGGHNGMVTVYEYGKRRSLTSAGSRILSLALNGEGSLLAVGRNNGGVQVFQLHDPQADVVSATCAGFVWSLAFTPDGRELCAVDEGRSLHVWSPDGKLAWRWPIPQLDAPPMWLELAPDAAYIATAAGGIAVLDLVHRKLRPMPVPSVEVESTLEAWRHRFVDFEATAAAVEAAPLLLAPLRTELTRRLRLEGDNPDTDVMDAVAMCAEPISDQALYEIARAKLERAGPRLPAWRAGDLPTRRALVLLRLGQLNEALQQLDQWSPPSDLHLEAEGRLIAAFVRARCWQLRGDLEQARRARAEFGTLAARSNREGLAQRFAAELEQGGR
jgi:WD40 repeat protein